MLDYTSLRLQVHPAWPQVPPLPTYSSRFVPSPFTHTPLGSSVEAWVSGFLATGQSLVRPFALW